MANTLRRLVNTSTYGVLQDKLDGWFSDYHVNSCDQNLNRCCELIELTAQIQSQLFTVLNLAAAEGGQYAGLDTLKTRLLPWLGTCSTARPPVSDHTSLELMQDSALKERQIRDLSVSHDNNMQKMETQLCSTRLQLNSVKSELAEVQLELDDTKDQSATTLLATEEEILQLRADLQATRQQLDVYQRKAEAAGEWEREVRLLRGEVSFLTSERSLLQGRLSRCRSPSPGGSSLRAESPTRARLTQSSRQARLLSRFSRLYATERLEAQSLLRRYVQDLCSVQKIIFIAAVESFHTAKLAYRQMKLRLRKSLALSHVGPESLEDAAVDYIIRNVELYDAQASVNDVINSMNVNPRISFPPEVDFSLISGLVRETCRLAFAMQTLEPPLDLAYASEGELFNEHRYRRSYDSDFGTPLVLFYVWPALMEGDSVLVKGEAVTRRGPLGRARDRSISPARSRSLSPSRAMASSSSPGRLSASWL